MKAVNLILKLLIITSLLFWSCSAKEEAQTNEEASTIEETEVKTEEKPEQIPSPLKNISETLNGVQVEMQYGSPGVKGRKIWGGLESYGEVWRTGANEATWISFDKDVMIDGNKVPAGKYGLFTIPNENEWTVILNKTWDQWGAYDYDADKDQLRFTLVPESLDNSVERLTFLLAEGKVKFMWEKVGFAFEITEAT